MDGELLGQLLGSAAIATVFTTVITAIVNRKKLGAEATHLITQAASSVADNLRKDNEGLRTKMAELSTELETFRRQYNGLEREMHMRDIRDQEFRLSLLAHNEYEVEMARALRDAGFEVFNPPPLEWTDYQTGPRPYNRNRGGDRPPT